MIADYLNQSVVWKKATGTNEFGEPVTASRTINVRYESKRKMVRDRTGQEVVSEARFFCLEDLRAGDLIEQAGRDWPIIAVTEVIDLDGNLVYRRADC